MAEGHWRDSARKPQFLGVDAGSAFQLLLFLLHIRVWTLIVAVVATFFFVTIAFYGFNIPVFLRWLRGFIMGKRKIASPWWR